MSDDWQEVTLDSLPALRAQFSAEIEKAEQTALVFVLSQGGSPKACDKVRAFFDEQREKNNVEFGRLETGLRGPDLKVVTTQ